MASRKYVAIAINVSEEERDRVHELARKRGYKITSDYLRSLIEADARSQGVAFTFSVDRGGYRRGDHNEEGEA